MPLPARRPPREQHSQNVKPRDEAPSGPPARKKRAAHDTAAPPRRKPARPSLTATKALVSELRTPHETAGGIDGWPGAAGGHGAPLRTGCHAVQRDEIAPEIRRHAALTRAPPWEHLREQVGLHRFRTSDATCNGARRPAFGAQTDVWEQASRAQRGT
ncbi:hypothetical protein M2169_006447 [Streptomyces sp. MJP52]|nr:hypothetical protein [Streptomyces sp. MJP52]